jgi:hypothetical protein
MPTGRSRSSRISGIRDIRILIKKWKIRSKHLKEIMGG